MTSFYNIFCAKGTASKMLANCVGNMFPSKQEEYFHALLIHKLYDEATIRSLTQEKWDTISQELPVDLKGLLETWYRPDFDFPDDSDWDSDD